MKPRISFAMIDAKEGPVIGGDLDGSHYGTKSKKNMRLIMRAETEYLNQLYVLQGEISDKLVAEMEDEPAKPDFTDNEEWKIESEENSLSRGILKPGADNLYYT